MSGSIVGTIGYMAPEQARAQEVDQRADIYALGLIFSDMLLGPTTRLEHTGGPMAELQHRLQHTLPGPRASDETIPEAVDGLIAKCLQHDPAERYQTTAALAKDLNRLDENGIPLPEPVPIWKSPRFWALATVVTLSLMGGTYWITRPPPAPVQHPPMSVLVADFDNRTKDPLFTGTLESPLATGMEGASFITSYSRTTARRLVGQIKPGAGLDAEGARLVSVREGIKVVLAGSIETNRAGYTVKVDAIDPGVNKVLATASASASSKDKVLAAIGAAAAELRGGLGDTSPQSARVAAMETVTVGSLEALQAYERGQALLAANKLQDALDAYKEAVRIDPGLGRAYAGMAVIYFDLKDEAKGKAAYEQALKRVDRMTDREKLRTLGTYYLLVARNYEKAIENYQTLLSQYPADSSAHGNLAIAAMYTGDLKRAVKEAREVVRIYPKNTRQRRNYAMYLMWSGDFDNAAAEGESVLKETPSYALGYLPIALSRAAKGDVAGALETYDRMEASGTSDGARLARLGRVDLAMYAGRYREATKLAASAVDADSGAGNPGALAADHLAAAETYLALGQKARVFEAATKAVSLSTHESVLFPAALLFIETGHPDEADKVAIRLENMLQTQTTAYARLIDGEGAVKRGRYAQAIEMFRDSLKRRDTWFGRFLLGKAYAETDHFAEAMAELEIAVNRRGEVTDVFINDTPTLRYLPAVYYWLGRSQQAMGAGNAGESYEQYLGLRANAEPPDPLAEDARNRLAAHAASSPTAPASATPPAATP
jgi:tetratricopeptide (TPR) repeat protein